MADITNPIAIKWANEELRPFAEYMLTGFIRAEEFIENYEDSVEAIITSADIGALIDDGREAEGITRLTREDVMGFVAVIKALQAGLNDGVARSTIRKPTVRTVTFS